MKAICAAQILVVGTFAIEAGYNSECRLDSECRALNDLPDICCAKLVYEAFGAQVEKR